MQDTRWDHGLTVTGEGQGLVGHAGAVLLRKLADQSGLTAALDAALCIVSALYEREGSQQGQVIDIAKHEVMASRVDYVLGQMVAGDMDASTRRTAFDLGGPAGIFRCVDGYAYIWMSAPAHWEGLRKLLGNPAWMNAFPERWMEKTAPNAY